MTNLLVTGGAGFIGANFVNYWNKHYPDDFIVVLDALTDAGNRQNLKKSEKYPSVNFVKGDILDQQLVEDLLRSRRLKIIVNFAAESHVNRFFNDPDVFLKTNVDGTHTLLKAARNVWLDAGENNHEFRFHHLSTVEVYGDLPHNAAPFSENSPYAPSSPFAASKAAADHLVRSYHTAYGLPITISNSPNNFGRFHFPNRLIPMVINNILYNKPLPICGDGQHIRDWLYVQDHCRGIEQILKKGVVGETYHIGARNEHTNMEIVEFICDHMDKLFARCSDYRTNHPNAESAAKRCSRKLITLVKERFSHDRRYALDTNKIKKTINWRPRYTFKGALEYTIGWYLRHMSWLDSVNKKGILKS
jgi:dTDP-glucose 4,6-dehydratase